MSMLLPHRIRVIKDVVIRIHRRLQGKGSLNIPQGAGVAPTDILGTSTIPSGFRILNLAQQLSVPPQDVQKYMRIALGQKIYKGELLAYKTGGVFGGKTIVVSPTDGVLDFLNPKTGELKMIFLPKKEALTSGVYGIVEAVDKERGQVTIRTQAALIYGMFGCGKVRDGILHIIGRRDELLGLNFVHSEYRGQILAGGSLVLKEAISSCISSGISGIITGGINAKDYKAMAGGRLIFPKKLENDSGISIVVLEGFGSIPVGEDIFAILAQYHSKFVQIDGNTGIIILPSFESKSMKNIEKTALPPESNIPGIYKSTQEMVELKTGLKVRIIGNSFTGEQGKIVAIDQTETLLPSGLKARLAIIETVRRKVSIPVANLEAIL